ncbi:MAG: EF-hand domain-containing protein [Akkermansiaceae bacterium]
MMKLVLIPVALFPIACSPEPRSPEVVGRKMIGLQQKFDLIDTDGDGYLTKSEIIAGYDSLGVVTQTSETADKIIKFYDFDGDGRISLREAQSGAVTGPEILIKQFEETE